jgi:hypothetical protein
MSVSPHIHLKELNVTTTLAFSSPGTLIPVGKSADLGTVDVHTFDRIRVWARNEAASPSAAVFHLTLEVPGSNAGDLDTLKVENVNHTTNVYEAPGTTLAISAEASGADAYVSMWIWGVTN